MTGRRLIVAERRAGAYASQLSLEATPGLRLTLGREAEIAIATHPPDERVSRSAATIECTEAGWTVAIHNRNGALLHPWGLPAWQARDREYLTDRRVALRILGDPGREHWILLENDALPATVAAAGGLTVRTDPVRPLTPAQLEVLFAVFGDLLAWPPRSSAAPGQLKQAARALGVSVSAVQDRLRGVAGKAAALGLSREVELTDPEYLHVLVRAGYLRPEGASLDPSRAGYRGRETWPTPSGGGTGRAAPS